MNWTVPGPRTSNNLFGLLAPEEILCDYDGPRLFTARGCNGELLLAYQCDEDATASRFVVVACDIADIADLKSGRRTVRSVLDQPQVWVVDQPHGQPVANAWSTQLSSIPAALLPEVA